MNVPKSYSSATSFQLLAGAYATAAAARDALQEIPCVLFALVLRLGWLTSECVHAGHLVNFINDPNATIQEREQRQRVLAGLWGWAGNGSLTMPDTQATLLGYRLALSLRPGQSRVTNATVSTFASRTDDGKERFPDISPWRLIKCSAAKNADVNDASAQLAFVLRERILSSVHFIRQQKPYEKDRTVN
jgi:hypothetical protein